MLKRLAVLALAPLALAGCGGAQKDKNAANQPLEGDSVLIAAAEKISDAVGGCTGGAAGDSKVVNIENGAIIMLACSKGSLGSTSRLFSAKPGAAPVMLALPDFEMAGWFASDQAAAPELDAGTGVLTTMRKDNAQGACGSEATYKWDGVRFAVQELRWRDCSEAGAPPFPLVWPAPTNNTIEAGATPPAP